MSTDPNCERYHRSPGVLSRRFRCGGCKRLVCSKCCTRGGRGQGQGSTRWAECFDCQATREAKMSNRKH